MANDNLIGYTYDKLDRVVLIQYGEEVYPNVNKASLRYDRMGNVCRVEDMELGKVYLYDYSDEGVLQYAVVIHADGEQQIMYSAEDNNGRTTSTSTAIDLAQSVTTTYTYGDTDTTISDKLTASSLAYQNGSITFNNAFYEYDTLDRLTSITLSGNGKVISKEYTFKPILEGDSSNVVSSLCWVSPGIESVVFDYEYDLIGNIIAIFENEVLIASYQYDDQGQVIYECLPTQNVEYEYTYDTYGNIRSVIKRNATTGLILDTQTYTYGDSIWLDKLTAFNGVSFTYDASGNPLTYNNGSAYTFTWDTARNLTSVVKGGVTTSYEYNADGLRTEKQYGTTTYKYYYDGNKLLRQTWGSESMDFLYDANGEIYSMIYGDTQYFYVKNLQGDVVQIRSKWGTVLVEYEYDAWGNCTVAYAHSSYGDLATLNPIRYRSYFYDFETGFYYLQSRYYDPQIRRFINADDPGMLGASNTFLSYNLYGYCENNPVNYFDIIGYAKININWVGFAIDAMLIIIPALYAMSKSLKTISKSFSAINKIGEAIIKKGDKLFKKLDDWFYCLCAREKSYLILKSLGPIFSIVTVVTSIGEIVEYVIDILDGKWDGYLDTSNIKPKITFQKLY